MAQSVLAKLGLLDQVSATTQATPQRKRGSVLGSPWARQLSEPAKFDQAFSIMDFSDLPPGLSGGHQASATMAITSQHKHGSVLGSPWARQVSEPAKFDQAGTATDFSDLPPGLPGNHQASATMPLTPQHNHESVLGSPWAQQVSEPAKVDQAGTATDFLALPPGLCEEQQSSEPVHLSCPPGLEVAAARQLCHPVKVCIDSLKVKMPKRPTELEDDDEEEDMTTTASTRSGNGSVRTAEQPSNPTSPAIGPKSEQPPRMLESPIYSTSPTHGPQLDALLRNGVGSPIYSTSPTFDPQSNALLADWSGQGLVETIFSEKWSAYAFTVMVRCMPKKYTEEGLLEELRDGGFAPVRDFDFFDFDPDSGCCMVNFVDVSTMRSFIAAFDGREMRLAADREFEVEVILC